MRLPWVIVPYLKLRLRLYPYPQFGKYLEEKQRPEWADQYLNYKALKDLIKAAYQQQQDAVRRLANVSPCIHRTCDHSERPPLIIVLRDCRVPWGTLRAPRL